MRKSNLITHAEHDDGQIRRLEKDCGCITHDGPHWLHMDDIVREIKATDADAQIVRLGQKLEEMTSRNIVRLLTEQQAAILTAARLHGGLESLLQLREHIDKEVEFNRTWIYLHLRDCHPEASERRKEVVAERTKWLNALDEAILSLAQHGRGAA